MRLLVVLASLSILAVAQQASATDCTSCLAYFCHEEAETHGVFFAELVALPQTIDEGYTMRVVRIEGEVDVRIGEEFEVDRRPSHEVRLGQTYLFPKLLPDGTPMAEPSEAMSFLVRGKELDCGISVKRAVRTALSSSCMDDVDADVQSCVDGLGFQFGPDCSSAQGSSSALATALAALGIAALRRRRSGRPS